MWVASTVAPKPSDYLLEDNNTIIVTLNLCGEIVQYKYTTHYSGLTFIQQFLFCSLKAKLYVYHNHLLYK